MNPIALVLLLVMLLTTSALSAQDLMQQMHLAQGYFDTGQFLQAQKIYQDLLKENLEPWQQEIITYNSECCLLAAGQWQLVSTQAKERLLQASSYPPLARNAALNNAIILLRSAEAMKKDPQAIALLKEAVVSLQDAQESDCEIALLEEKAVCEEAQDIKEVHAEIDQLLAVTPAPEMGDPLIKLHLAFSAAMAQFPLKAETLNALLDQLQEVSKAPREAKHLLELSLTALKNSKPKTARAFLVASDHLIQEANFSKESIPLKILQGALEQQEDSLHLTLLSKRSVTEGVNADLSAIAVQLQTAVVNRAAPFLDAVSEQQKRDFTKTCQEKPWDLVIPLYLKGDAAAKHAEADLKANKLDEALNHQLLAINSWKAALDALNRAKSEAQQEQEKQQNKPEQQQPASLTNSVPQLLQQLEEMEADDKLQPVLNPNRQEVEKPW